MFPKANETNLIILTICTVVCFHDFQLYNVILSKLNFQILYNKKFSFYNIQRNAAQMPLFMDFLPFRPAGKSANMSQRRLNMFTFVFEFGNKKLIFFKNTNSEREFVLLVECSIIQINIFLNQLCDFSNLKKVI